MNAAPIDASDVLTMNRIGLFDSGVGGLTIWREVVRVLPHHDLVYFADQAHCPFGSRSPEEIRLLSQRATELLLTHGTQLIVVACNTASAAALDHLRSTFPQIPIVGMEPAIKPAIAESRTRKIGVLATPGTFSGALFARTSARFSDDATIIPQTVKGLVEKIERGEIGSAETEQLLRRSIEPLIEAGVDEIVLGCTHYPFVAPLIRQIVGDHIALVDPSAAVAAQVARVVDARGWRTDSHHSARYRFLTSGDPQAFARIMEKLIGYRGSIEPVV